jgi:hypothetical protein
MRRWLLILATFITILATLFGVQPARAQNDISFQSMQVEIWPEYDRPSVLVIYRITLSSQVKLPADIILTIPQAAIRPSAVAEQTANGLYNLSYTPYSQDKDWIKIKFTTTLPQVEFEYYDPNLYQNGADHHYTFNWSGDYAVEDMNINVQQPRTATSMTVQPNLGVSGPSSDNLVYFNIPVGSVTSGGTFKLEVNYQKPDASLTRPSTFEGVTPAAPVDQTTLGRINFTETIPWAIGGLGLLLIIVGGVWFWRSNLQTAGSSRSGKQRQRREKGKPAPSEISLEGGVFCHKCGKRAGPDDLFCRACGVKLKK